MKLTSTTAAERSMSSGGCGRKGARLGVQVAISATLCIILLLVTVSTRSVVAEKEMPGPTVGPNPVQATSFRSGIESQWSEILNIAPAVDKIVRSDTYACFAGIKANATKTLWTKLDQQPSSLVALFVHVPKCGGSALTTVLRRFACEANGPSSDCCANPGFCQRAKGAMRTCSSLPGCHGHVPHLRVYAAKPRYANVKAVTMLRDPVSRVISAWHYRCHNPNFDCYDVPGAAKWGLQLRLARGKPIPRGVFLPTTNVTFVEYVTRWPAYHDVQTRMLGRDEFPYAPLALDATDLRMAIDTIETRFSVVTIFELFDHSVALLAALAGLDLHPTDFRNVRSEHTESHRDFKNAVMSSVEMVEKIRAANSLDLRLHQYATRKLCAQLSDAHLLGADRGCTRTSEQEAARQLKIAEIKFCGGQIRRVG